MKIKRLILVNGKNEELVFDKKINVIEDQNLVKELRTENIKNEDSIYSIQLNQLIHISDVIQIKVNVKNTGVFLVNFEKEGFSEDIRTKLISEISSLKDKNEISLESQTSKVTNLLKIINLYNPIYVTFLNNLEYKIDINNISEKINWSFPLLLLISKTNKTTNLNIDALFLGLFSTIVSGSSFLLIHFLLNKLKLFYVLIFLILILSSLVTYVTYKAKYGKKPAKPLRLLCFSIIGVFLGAVLGIAASKYGIKGENIVFDLKKIIIIGLPVSLGITLISHAVTYLIKHVINVKTNKKCGS